MVTSTAPTSGHHEPEARHHEAAATIQNQLYWRLVERDEKRRQVEERRHQREHERRNAAALVLQNELYWRPLERMERAIQREENLAARTIQEALVNWFIRTRGTCFVRQEDSRSAPRKLTKRQSRHEERTHS